MKVLANTRCDSDGINSSLIYYIALLETGLIEKENLIVKFCKRENGYGLQNQYFDEFKEEGVELVATGDIGITAKKQVEYAKSLGIEVLISDHHPIQEDLLPDTCVVNPKLGDEYFYDLAGCGVVYILMKRMYKQLNIAFDKKGLLLSHFCIGTVGDMVALTGINRILCKAGISSLERSCSPAIQLLLSKQFSKEIETDTISFGIVPLINSMNRIDDIYKAFEFFTCTDENKLKMLYKKLYDTNEARKTKQYESIEIAKDYIKKNRLENSDFFFIPIRTHSAICGLVSSWITNTYGKPSMVVSYRNDTFAGSGRSIGSFSFRKLIPKFKNYVNSAGGHDFAMGISIPENNLDKIRKIIKEHCANESTEYKCPIDYELTFTDVINPSFVNRLYDSLAPFGQGNPKPLFITKKVQISSMRVSSNGRHTFFVLDSLNSGNPWTNYIEEVKAVAFNYNEENFDIGDIVDVIYTIGKNGSIIISSLKRC